MSTTWASELTLGLVIQGDRFGLLLEGLHLKHMFRVADFAASQTLLSDFLFNFFFTMYTN